MRRITFAVVSTIAAVVMLFSYRTSRGPVEEATAAPAGGGADAGVVQGNGNPPAGAAPNQGTAPNQGSSGQTQNGQNQSQTPQPGTVTVNGKLFNTAQGPVQVQVKIAGGRLIESRAIVRPTGEARHEEVNTFALPKLRAQALSAQSAQIDGVSGATATSGGYKQSLQSALDAANFG